ncbi:MAG: glycosyltransferase family 4 protein [Ardenticatenaceae bacterium]|nr:glycosyltransferase family 4 protein [Ardenticatenaceae bacterium]
MNVALILSSPPSVFGGIETIADNLARALLARGHGLSLVTGAPRPVVRDLASMGGAVELSPPPAASPATRALARLLRTAPLNAQSLLFFLRFLASPRSRRLVASADAAVTFFEGEAVLFSHYLRRRGVGTVYYYHGGIDARWARLDRSTRRVAISHTIATRSAEYHAYPCHGVVWPGVASEWLAQPCAADNARDPQRLVYAGRLERTPKRPDRLLACFAALAPEFPGLTLRFVGDGPMRADLEQQAVQAGVAGRVIFTGTLPLAGVHAELQQADLFLFPSTYESFGLSVLEAMAAGVPVVASDLPALREATGAQVRLVPSDDLSAWVEAARRLLSDAELRQARARAGRIWASQFTWARAAARLEHYLVEATRQRIDR